MDKFVAFVMIFAVIVFFSFIFAFPVMWLWNGTLIYVVTWAKPVTLMQAWGMSLLSSLFFKNTSTSFN